VVFHLVPPCYEEHISSIYAEIESPGVEFESFWQVYNQVRNAVDKDLLFEAAAAAYDEENASTSEEPDANQLPLHHLGPCEFGKNGVPAAQSTCEGEAYYLQYHAFLLPNLSSFQNILQSLVRENLVWYFKAHFSKCSYSHYKMMVMTSWSSSQTMKAMSYINLFTRNPSACPVSVVFDLFTYYNKYLWLVVKIYLSKWYLRNVESTWGLSSMLSRIDLTGLTSYNVYDLVVHLPTKGLICFISLVNILSYFMTNTSLIGIQS
jgi:hypothetical protein